jgi:hypothetical protein
VSADVTPQRAIARDASFAASLTDYGSNVRSWRDLPENRRPGRRKDRERAQKGGYRLGFGRSSTIHGFIFEHWREPPAAAIAGTCERPVRSLAGGRSIRHITIRPRSPLFTNIQLTADFVGLI